MGVLFGLKGGAGGVTGESQEVEGEGSGSLKSLGSEAGAAGEGGEEEGEIEGGEEGGGEGLMEKEREREGGGGRGGVEEEEEEEEDELDDDDDDDDDGVALDDHAEMIHAIHVHISERNALSPVRDIIDVPGDEPLKP
jgi:hypothetical protein